MSEAIHKVSQSSFVDAFLLRRAERTVASFPETRTGKMREFFAAAEVRSRAADELFEGQAPAALPILREAAVLYMAALVTGFGSAQLDEPLRTADVLAEFEKFEPKRPCPSTPQEFTAFLELLITADPMALDRLSPGDAAEKTRPVRTLVAWLRELNEPRTLREIKVQRLLRVGLASLVVLGSLLYGLTALFSPKNIGLHKPVTTSSVFPGAAVNPPALTDGVTSGGYAVHTNKEENPWVQVDLEDVYQIKKVKIYNRGDGWFDEGLPMTLEFSENGTNFVEMDKRTKTFGQWVPWSVDGEKKKARYVRVHGNRGSYVSLNEIEIFGSK